MSFAKTAALLVIATFAAEPPVDDVVLQALLPPISAERLAQLEVISPSSTFRRGDRIALSEEHARMVKTMTGAMMLSEAIEVYEAKRGDKTVSFISFFNTPEQSGALCKVAVSVLPNGRNDRVVPFPSSRRDPMSGRAFLHQFVSKRPNVNADWQEGLAIHIPAGREAKLTPFVRGARVAAALLVVAKSLRPPAGVDQPPKTQP